MRRHDLYTDVGQKYAVTAWTELDITHDARELHSRTNLLQLMANDKSGSFCLQTYSRVLFYMTTTDCHFPRELRGRSDDCDTLMGETRLQQVAADSFHIK